MKKKILTGILSMAMLAFIFQVTAQRRETITIDNSNGGGGSGGGETETCAFDGNDCASGDVQCTSCEPVVITP